MELDTSLRSKLPLEFLVSVIGAPGAGSVDNNDYMNEIAPDYNTEESIIYLATAHSITKPIQNDQLFLHTGSYE